MLLLETDNSDGKCDAKNRPADLSVSGHLYKRSKNRW